ncbi:MAG TPA: hypothetical protein VE263_15585 [Candidatus Angelobacter sp.]|nr:hypothetical protein [Candidatus Angelobacter sp.]
MKKRAWIALAFILPLLAAAVFYGYQKWGAQNSSTRNDLLAMMPADASAVVFVNLSELRAAPFLAQLYAWAPKPQADPDYLQFVKDTGFDYERDLDRLALAIVKHGQQSSTLFVIADGRFDKAKISAFASKTGTVSTIGARELFSVPASDGAKRIAFTFLRNGRIALGDGPELAGLLNAKNRSAGSADWRPRFERLAGSPVFAVIRQDAAIGDALVAQAPSGLRSPQLSTLLDQLQWITIAGKPQNDRLQIVAEGESTAETTTRQLADVLNGVLILAEAGLNDAKTRQQLDPAARAAYLELVKSANVDKIDRGDTKSVRLAFEITPAFLESSRRAPAEPPPASSPKPLPGKASPSRKGHT